MNTKTKSNANAAILNQIVSSIHTLEEKYGIILPTSKEEADKFMFMPGYTFKYKNLKAELFADAVKTKGFDGLPQIVSNSAYQKMDGFKFAFFKDEVVGKELYRGVRDMDYHANLLCDEKYHHGMGDMSGGIFAAIVEVKAKNYTDQNGTDYVLKLKAPNMKIVGLSTLFVQLSGFLNKSADLKKLYGDKFDMFQEFKQDISDTDFNKVVQLIVENMGLLAMFLDYEAVYNDTFPEIAILNRAKICVSQSEYERVCAASTHHKAGRGDLGKNMQ